MSRKVFNRLPAEHLSAGELATTKKQFDSRAENIVANHLRQSADEAAVLINRYSRPALGRKPMIDWLYLLAACIDPSDIDLGCVSQLTHSLQVADSAKEAGLGDDIVLVALVHDIGKLLLLTNEPPCNIVGPNVLIAGGSSEVGLENSLVSWNHDEFAYQRLSAYLTDDQLWLIRFHSLRFETAERYMSPADRDRHKRLLLPFRKHDLRSKDTFRTPRRSLRDYAELLDRYFPGDIVL